jgi:hypothetical protein
MSRNVMMLVGVGVVLYLLTKKAPGTVVPYYLAKPTDVEPSRIGEPPAGWTGSWGYSPGY